MTVEDLVGLYQVVYEDLLLGLSFAGAQILGTSAESRGQVTKPGLPGNWPLKWCDCEQLICFMARSMQARMVFIKL